MLGRILTGQKWFSITWLIDVHRTISHSLTVLDSRLLLSLTILFGESQCISTRSRTIGYTNGASIPLTPPLTTSTAAPVFRAVDFYNTCLFLCRLALGQISQNCDIHGPILEIDYMRSDMIYPGARKLPSILSLYRSNSHQTPILQLPPYLAGPLTCMLKLEAVDSTSKLQPPHSLYRRPDRSVIRWRRSRVPSIFGLVLPFPIFWER